MGGIKLKKYGSVLLAGVIVSGLFPIVPKAEESSNAVSSNTQVVWEADNYSAYLENNALDSESKTNIVLDSTCLVGDKTYIQMECDGQNGVLSTEESDDSLNYQFTVTKTGWYEIEVAYYPYEGKGGEIERMIYLDGELPFSEAGCITFSRAWKDSEAYTTDALGNQTRSEQVEVKSWMVSEVKDGTGTYDGALKFYLSEGEHTLQLVSVSEPMLVQSILLKEPETVSSYEEVKEGYEAAGYQESTESLKVQAENLTLKSDPTIYASNDRGSYSVEPQSADYTQLNVLSGDNFQNTGEWAEWTIDVPQTGLYKLAIKYRQNDKSGSYSVRTLKINGEIPFAEAADLQFPYTSKWVTTTLQSRDGEDYWFYLEQGQQTIRLEVALGDYSESIRKTSEEVDRLNEVYRNILMITGPTPDQYRDYDFPTLIPGELEEMAESITALKEIIAEIEDISGKSGSEMSTFKKLIADLEIVVNHPAKLAGKLSNIKTNIGALADWVISAKAQPMDMDYFELIPPKEEVAQPDNNIFKSIYYESQLFINSFVLDYDSMQVSKGDETITVWIGNSGIPGSTTGSGQDQAQIIKQLIQNTFSEEYSIGVNLQLVASGTLLSSVLAGTGPDVALQLSSSEPMNYAVRGAAADLTQFDDFEEVISRFSPQSYTAYTFMGKTYALPETFSFPVLFYRKDILDMLGLNVPSTWNEVYDVMVNLSENNLKFGIPSDISTYYMLLFQEGEDIYTENGEAVNFTSQKGIQAFTKWTEFYTDYSCSVEYSFVNRFRTGEMPIGIADYTVYNQLSVFAPELKGLWDFTVLPGTVNKDGTVNHYAAGSGVGCMLLAQSEHTQASWEFMKWWTDSDTQLQYANELEAVMGVAARYPTANLETLSKLAWNSDSYKTLLAQWEVTQGIAEVPGSYITSRYVNFAFKAVVNESENAGRQLLEYSRLINAELERKRNEFGL